MFFMLSYIFSSIVLLAYLKPQKRNKQQITDILFSHASKNPLIQNLQINVRITRTIQVAIFILAYLTPHSWVVLWGEQHSTTDPNQPQKHL